MSSKSN